MQSAVATLPLDDLDKLRATWAQRLLTFLLDFATIWVLVFVVITAIAGAGYESLFKNAIFEWAFFPSLTALYYVPQELFGGRTLGKRVMRTQVVTEKGAPPSVGHVLGRTLCRFIPFEQLSFLAGSGKPRGVHDFLSATYVITTKPPRPILPSRSTASAVEPSVQVDPTEIGRCPNCGKEVLVAAPECRSCGAVFGPQSSWKVIRDPSNRSREV